MYTFIEETTRFYIAILGSLQDAIVLLYFNSLVILGVGIIRTSQAGLTMTLIYRAYKDSRDMGEMWCNAGKPRQGQIFELYRQSKSICKYAIPYIKRHEKKPA